MSRDDAPTWIPNCPLTTLHACVLTFQMEKARELNENEIELDCPAARVTFSNALSCRGGSP